MHIEDTEHTFGIPNPTLGPSSEVMGTDLSLLLEELNNNQREIIKLRYYDGCSLERICGGYRNNKRGRAAARNCGDKETPKYVDGREGYSIKPPVCGI